MCRIEQGLHALHAEEKPRKDNPKESVLEQTGGDVPFAILRDISKGSPAAEAVGGSDPSGYWLPTCPEYPFHEPTDGSCRASRMATGLFALALFMQIISLVLWKRLHPWSYEAKTFVVLRLPSVDSTSPCGILSEYEESFSRALLCVVGSSPGGYRALRAQERTHLYSKELER